MAKEIDYRVPLNVADTWQRTLDHWEVQKVKTRIKRAEVAPDQSHGIMEIEQMPSFTSWGQNYVMEFTPVDQNTTAVHVRVWLNWGTGMQWMKPNDVLKKWAASVGAPHENIAKGGIACGVTVLTCSIVLIVVMILVTRYL